MLRQPSATTAISELLARRPTRTRKGGGGGSTASDARSGALAPGEGGGEAGGGGGGEGRPDPGEVVRGITAQVLQQ